MNSLRIAIQSKGRLCDPSIEFLHSVGLEFTPNGRNCMTSCKNYPVDIFYLRDDDIPEYVMRGAVDFGIVGENVLLEKNAWVKIYKKLDFGGCSVVIAIPENSSITSVQELDGTRIATSYPNVLARFLKNQNIEATIINLKGSVEIAPTLNLADAICDITQSGKTLKDNGLKPLITIFESQAVFIQKPLFSDTTAAALTQKLFAL